MPAIDEVDLEAFMFMRVDEIGENLSNIFLTVDKIKMILDHQYHDKSAKNGFDNFALYLEYKKEFYDLSELIKSQMEFLLEQIKLNKELEKFKDSQVLDDYEKQVIMAKEILDSMGEMVDSVVELLDASFVDHQMQVPEECDRTSTYGLVGKENIPFAIDSFLNL